MKIPRLQLPVVIDNLERKLTIQEVSNLINKNPFREMLDSGNLFGPILQAPHDQNEVMIKYEKDILITNISIDKDGDIIGHIKAMSERAKKYLLVYYKQANVELQLKLRYVTTTGDKDENDLSKNMLPITFDLNLICKDDPEGNGYDRIMEYVNKNNIK